eukprot:366528-Chlamydomonas_euryale.AAC.14
MQRRYSRIGATRQQPDRSTVLAGGQTTFQQCTFAMCQQLNCVVEHATQRSGDCAPGRPGRPHC